MNIRSVKNRLAELVSGVEEMEDNLARYEVRVADRFGWRTIGLVRLKAEADRMAAAYRRKDWVRAVRVLELETV